MSYAAHIIRAAAQDHAARTAATIPPFAHSPSFADWSVMIWGGTDPRTGFELPPMEFVFSKRRHGYGYTLPRVIARTDELAGLNHRTMLAVRDTDGEIVACQPVCWPDHVRTAA